MSERMEEFCSNITPKILNKLEKYWSLFQWEVSYSVDLWDYVFAVKATIKINDKSFQIKWADRTRNVYKKDIDIELLTDEIVVMFGSAVFNNLRLKMTSPETKQYVNDTTSKLFSKLEKSGR